jgi:hypothetical protein
MAKEVPGEIEISEHGEAIFHPDREAVHELRVETHDPTTQIVVLNDRFDAVIKAAGSVAKILPAGIYKIRVQRGASSIGFEDRLVVLDRDSAISIEPPRLSSPAPIGGTRASEAHIAAREWLDGVVHVGRGEGSKIALLARYAAPKQGTKPLLDPFHGLQLLRADGRLLVDLERAAPKVHIPDTDDPISVCGIAVNPGAYILRHRLATGRDLAQSVVASSGWQITINIRRSQQDVDSKKKLFVRSGYVASLMRRLIDKQSAEHAPMRDSEDGPIDEDQLVDIARQGLADGARLLRGNLYDLLLRDFENPLVGIVGGLLLDLEREAVGATFASEHAALFDTAVTKLRKIVGREHPDVEALSFRCQDPRLAHRGPIDARPMFHRSWRIILGAASKRRNLVPLDLWKRTTASGSMPPYLIWSLETSAQQTSLRRLRTTASDLSTLRIVAPVASANLELLASPTADTQDTAPPSRTVRLDASQTRVSPGSAAHKSKTAKLSQEAIALEMGVPANALSHLVDGPKRVARSLRGGKIVAKASARSRGRSAGSFAAKKVTSKSTTSGTVRSKAKKAPAKGTGSAGAKVASKKEAAGTKGVGSGGRLASTKVKAGTKPARRSSRRKSARR